MGLDWPRHPSLTKVRERTKGQWHYVRWSDGTEQWSIPRRTGDQLRWVHPACLFVERLCYEKSIRHKWHVVNRCTDKSTVFPGITEFDSSPYPPVVSGPFDSLQGAKAALIVLLTTLGE